MFLFCCVIRLFAVHMYLRFPRMSPSTKLISSSKELSPFIAPNDIHREGHFFLSDLHWRNIRTTPILHQTPQERIVPFSPRPSTIILMALPLVLTSLDKDGRWEERWVNMKLILAFFISKKEEHELIQTKRNFINCSEIFDTRVCYSFFFKAY